MQARCHPARIHIIGPEPPGIARIASRAQGITCHACIGPSQKHGDDNMMVQACRCGPDQFHHFGRLPGKGEPQPCFFKTLTHGGIAQPLTGLDHAARQTPFPFKGRLAALHQKDRCAAPAQYADRQPRGPDARGSAMPVSHAGRGALSPCRYGRRFCALRRRLQGSAQRVMSFHVTKIISSASAAKPIWYPIFFMRSPTGRPRSASSA